MTTLAQIITTHHGAIVERWTDEASRVAAARGLDRPAFQNLMPTYLHSIAEAGDELGYFTGRRRSQLEAHLSSRIRQGFQLPEIVEEIALLGRCIAETWRGEATAQPSPMEIERLFLELHQASIVVTELFASHMSDDEQVEKQFLRRLTQIATASLNEGGPYFLDRLQEVVALFMEALSAQTATMILYSRDTEELQSVASVGDAREGFQDYVSSRGLSSFTAKVAGSEEPTSIEDVCTTELDVSESLRKSGIHSLLGVRLPPREKLIGVLFVGLSATRPFFARETHRLETLAERLTTHLENAQLYAQLREKNYLLQAERELRERFVSVLAHDLRGPLATAKSCAQLLIRHPETLDQRRELAQVIDRSVDLTDRMIRDLLDANRIRAGKPLALRLDECDLRKCATDCIAEMVEAHDLRFVLDAKESVVGWWSTEELRRALWNLLTNAVKYGDPVAPIDVGVRRTDTGAELSVHNQGPPISPHEQLRLFEPYNRASAGLASLQRGWGLGLTLVQGCALAHGGSVDVESSAASGTTFTIRLPPDARPFQPQAE